MARKPSPWYRSARNEWWVRINGVDHNLGEHPDDARKPKKSEKSGKWNAPPEIEKAFRELMDSEGKTVSPSESAASVIDRFLEWVQHNRAPKTYKWYRDFLQSFLDSCGSVMASRLKKSHASEWLASNPQWNASSKRGALTALLRAFEWAVNNDDLDKNPFKGLEKPQANRRKDVLTPEEFDKLMEHIPDEQLRDLLIVSFDCGARPQEVKDLEARHVCLEKQCAVIPAEEAKGKRQTRVVIFPTDRSMEVMRRLCETRPEGSLFINKLGNPWTAMAVKCRFAKLDHVLGRRVTHYAFRRSFITRKIVAGVDSHVVAQLAGHSSTAMIDKHYSAVAQDLEYLLSQAKKDVT